MEAKNQIPVFDAVKYKQHARIVTCADGKKRTEKRPIQKSVLAVDAAGNVLWLPLYTGPAQRHEQDQYRMSIEHAKRKSGWVVHGRCPQGEGYEVVSRLPESVRNRPMCKTAPNGEEVSDKNPCRCMVELIKDRREDNRLRMASIEGTARTSADRAHDMQADILKATLDQNARIAKVLERGIDKGGK